LFNRIRPTLVSHCCASCHFVLLAHTFVRCSHFICLCIPYTIISTSSNWPLSQDLAKRGAMRAGPLGSRGRGCPFPTDTAAGWSRSGSLPLALYLSGAAALAPDLQRWVPARMLWIWGVRSSPLCAPLCWLLLE